MTVLGSLLEDADRASLVEGTTLAEPPTRVQSVKRWLAAHAHPSFLSSEETEWEPVFSRETVTALARRLGVVAPRARPQDKARG